MDDKSGKRCGTIGVTDGEMVREMVMVGDGVEVGLLVSVGVWVSSIRRVFLFGKHNLTNRLNSWQAFKKALFHFSEEQ